MAPSSRARKAARGPAAGREAAVSQPAAKSVAAGHLVLRWVLQTKFGFVHYSESPLAAAQRSHTCPARFLPLASEKKPATPSAKSRPQKGSWARLALQGGQQAASRQSSPISSKVAQTPVPSSQGSAKLWIPPREVAASSEKEKVSLVGQLGEEDTSATSTTTCEISSRIASDASGSCADGDGLDLDESLHYDKEEEPQDDGWTTVPIKRKKEKSELADEPNPGEIVEGQAGVSRCSSATDVAESCCSDAPEASIPEWALSSQEDEASGWTEVPKSKPRPAKREAAPEPLRPKCRDLPFYPIFLPASSTPAVLLRSQKASAAASRAPAAAAVSSSSSSSAVSPAIVPPYSRVIPEAATWAKKAALRFEVGVPQEDSFNVMRRLLVPAGGEIKVISEQTGAKLCVRGLGSAHLEGLERMEAQEPLMICIASPAPGADEDVSLATALVEELVLSLQDQYSSHCRKRDERRLRRSYA